MVGRTIGFRVGALVTGNDTDPAYVAAAASEEGSDGHGMVLRINGAAILCRGANMIPMDNMEARMASNAHAQLVERYAAGGTVAAGNPEHQHGSPTDIMLHYVTWPAMTDDSMPPSFSCMRPPLWDPP